MEQHYPLVSKVSSSMQKQLDELYLLKKFEKIKLCLSQEPSLWNSDNASLFLKEVLINTPEQCRKYLKEWKFTEVDYENITVHSYSGSYAIAMINMEDFEKAKFALYLLNRDLNVHDAFGKLGVVIRYAAFSDKFWDTLLEGKYLGLLEAALRKLKELKNDFVYQRELKILENKIIARGNEAQVKCLAPYLSLDGWKSLSLPLLKAAMAYEKPPISFVNFCLDGHRKQEFAAIVEKYELPEYFQRELCLEDYFDFFKIYVTARPLSENVLRQIFTEDGKKMHSDEYKKYHKISFWKKVGYYLGW